MVLIAGIQRGMSRIQQKNRPGHVCTYLFSHHYYVGGLKATSVTAVHAGKIIMGAGCL